MEFTPEEIEDLEKKMRKDLWKAMFFGVLLAAPLWALIYYFLWGWAYGQQGMQ